MVGIDTHQQTPYTILGWRPMCLLWLFVLFSVPTTRAQDQVVRVGVLYPRTDSFSWHACQTAANATLAQIETLGLLPDSEIQLHWRDDQCELKQTIRQALDLRDHSDVHMLMGVPCDPGNYYTSMLAEVWMIPFISFHRPELPENDSIATRVHDITRQAYFEAFFKQLLAELGEKFTKVTSVYTGHTTDCELLSKALKKGSTRPVMEMLLDLEERAKEFVIEIVSSVKPTVEDDEFLVLFTCLPEALLIDFLQTAEEEGIIGATSKVLIIALNEKATPETLIYSMSTENNTFKHDTSFSHFLLVSYYRENHEIPVLDGMPQLITDQKNNHTMFDMYALYLSMLKIANIVNRSSIENSDMSVDEIDFMTLMADVTPAVDAIGYCFDVWQLDADDGMSQQWLHIDVHGHGDDLDVSTTIISNLTFAPSPIVTYAFMQIYGTKVYGGSAIFIGICVVVAIGLIGLRKYKKMRLKKYRENNRKWEIDATDLKYGTDTGFTSILGISSEMASYSPSKRNVRYFTGERDIALWKQHRVMVTRFTFAKLNIPKQAFREWSIVYEMNHANTARFLGASIEDTLVTLAFEYCGRGSLQDLIDKKSMKLTNSMKFMLFQDLVNGLQYIHKSDLGSHGNLSSSNCYVTKQWDLKIGGYGLKFPGRLQTDCKRYNDMLVMAPELLRMHIGARPHNGTKEGDVFSFGMILHEVATRCHAYNNPSDVQSVIDKIRKDNYGPKDVVVNSAETEYEPWNKLMNACWEKNPARRPTVAQVKSVLQKNRPDCEDKTEMATKFDLVSNYISNVEEEITSRGKRLVALEAEIEQMRSLFIPKIDGETFITESNWVKQYHKSCVAFLNLEALPGSITEDSASACIERLNAIFTLFDGILEKHCLVKVQAFGSRYMFVGGIAECHTDLAHSSADLTQLSHSQESLTATGCNPAYQITSDDVKIGISKESLNTISEVTEPKHHEIKQDGEKSAAVDGDGKLTDLEIKDRGELLFSCRVAAACLDMLSVIYSHQLRNPPLALFTLAIGVDSGSITAGVTGGPLQCFSVFGDSVDNAISLHIGARPMSIRISEGVYNMLVLAGGFKMSSYSSAILKGKESKTFQLNGRDGFNKRLPPPDFILPQNVD